MATGNSIHRASLAAIVAVGFILPGGSSGANAKKNPVALSELLSVSGLLAPEQKDLHLFGGVLDVGDVNGDGYDDLLISILSDQPKNPKSRLVYPDTINQAKPVLLVFNPSAGKYEIDQRFETVAPELIWPRRGLIKDLDGDGRNDIFVGGAGVEFGANVARCGDQNALILNPPSGYLNATDRLPKVSDISHGLISGDFDQDGLPDLFILNQTFLDKGVCPKGKQYATRSYMISDFGTKAAFKDGLKIRSADINLSEGNNTFVNGGITATLNGDPFPDLVLGGDTRLEIITSTGALTYVGEAQLKPPKEYIAAIDRKNCLLSTGSNKGECVTPYSAEVTYDVDGDGQQEVIAALLAQSRETGWKGEYLQVAKKGPKGWMDVTDEIVPDQIADTSSDGNWCFALYKVDIDLDGKDDLLCSTYSGARVWLFRDGKFVTLSKILGSSPDSIGGIGSFFAMGLPNVVPVRLGDQPYLVGFDIPSWNMAGGLQIYGWPLSEPR